MTPKDHFRDVCLAAATIALALVFSLSMASAAEPKRVLLLHSFGTNFKPWSEYAKSIRAALDQQSPWPLDITEHSLVTARFSDDPETAFAAYLRSLYSVHPLDLIISIGAPAAAFVQQHRTEVFGNTPMILTAVEQRRVRYSVLTDNDTVVAVTLDLSLVIENILQVLPGTRNVTAINGSSPLERFWQAEMQKEFQPLEKRVSFTWTNTMPFEDILKHAAKLPPHSAIFWGLMITDAAGVVHQGDAALAKLHSVTNAPIFSFDDSFFGTNLVGGPMYSVDEGGQRTAAVAIRILNGERPADVKTPPIGFAAPKFDWREMRRWGVSEDRLPPGSIVEFRPPSLWAQFRIQIIAVGIALLLQAALISWLIYEHWRRQVAEAVSLQHMNELARMNRFATAGEMSASIAHEIRQPLAAIAFAGSAALNWLKLPDINEVRSALRTIVDESHRADDVIKSVRAMFRSDPTVRAEVNLNHLVKQVLLLVARSIDSHDIALQTRLPDNPPPMVTADPIQLQQVLLNLIMNAIEALSASSHWARLLRIETGTDQSGVFLLVEDSGPGFDQMVAGNLFSPFVTTKPTGMGLGLSICKSIIEKHEGRLTAASVEPRGALMRIVLPCAQRTAAPA